MAEVRRICELVPALRLKAPQTLYDHRIDRCRMRGYALCELGVLRLATGFLREQSDLQELTQTIAHSNNLLSETDSKRIMNLITMGKAHNACSNIDEALTYFNMAIELYKERGDMYGVANVVALMVETYAELGDWRKMFDARSIGIESTPKSAKESVVYSDLVGGWASAWVLAGRYAEATHNSRISLTIKRSLGMMYVSGSLRDLGFSLGMQGRYAEAAQWFIEATENFSKFSPKEDLSALRHEAAILLRRGDWQKAEVFLKRSHVTNVRLSKQRRLSETLCWLGYLYELQMNWDQAEHLYREVLSRRSTKRYYFECAALTGLVRSKYAQGDYDAIPRWLTEAEQLAQQYEYNDHLASLRLTEGHIAWNSRIVEWGTGFDVALSFYQHALIYALRYNRFLLDEVLWGGVESVCRYSRSS